MKAPKLLYLVSVKTHLFSTALFFVIACGNQEASTSSGVEASTTESDEAQAIVDAAIAAHGGFDKLKAASTWVAEIRRFQRGGSYELTNYYRPGMVRLEQDLGDGEKSADVIGDPHCWGRMGPASFPCSPETRENDRPRVIMEMAAQLWPLKSEAWVIEDASTADQEGVSFDLVTARYLPRDTVTRFTFDAATHLLESIAVEGVKAGVLGTHQHLYSDYKEYCGVLMPSHNIKSFEGDIWVEEDVIKLDCRPVPESLFERPPQVTEGTIVEGRTDPSTVVCREFDPSTISLEEADKELLSVIADKGLDVVGSSHRQIPQDGKTRICAPVETDLHGETRSLIVESLPETEILSIFSLHPYDSSSLLVDALLAEAGNKNLKPSGPLRLMQYDHDGMGPTGELVVELQLPVERSGI